MLIGFLSIGAAAMLIPILLQAYWLKMKLWKSVPITLLLLLSGTLGAYTLFLVENGWFGGISFYGAVFLVPILFPIIAFVLREPYHRLMDLCAPAECMMLVFMKVHCVLSGCCGGRVLCTNSAGLEVVFPSQIAEAALAVTLLAVLLILARKKPGRGDLFPLYMILYGACRFVLNFMRADQSVFLLGMPAGHFWSVVSALVGLLWLMLLRKKEKAQA
jgi:phosphatidylglycerol:prolipoprotein diacylglycerol transferase